MVACSVGRGAGDRLSDLDMGMGVSDDVFDKALGLRALLPAAMGRYVTEDLAGVAAAQPA